MKDYRKKTGKYAPRLGEYEKMGTWNEKREEYL
jgi:hypothetical protein